MKKLLTAVVALTTIASLCQTASAGKGGPGGMSSGMSRSMGSNMSRSMGGGMSMRSVGGMSSMSSRSMSGSNFNSRNVIPGGAARSIGGTTSRNLGGSSLGGVRSPVGGIGNSGRNLPSPGGMISKSPITTTRPDLGRVVGKQFDNRLNKTFDRGVVGDLGKGKLGDIVGRGVAKDLGKSKLGDMVGRGATKDLGNGRLGDLLGTKNVSGRTGSVIADSLKTGRIRSGDLAKIDRSKLRDLVRGIESGKGGAGTGSLPIGGGKGGILNGFDKGFSKSKGHIADAILGGGLKPFNPGSLLGGKSSHKSAVAGMLAAGHFSHHYDHHHHHHGHHGHWFDFCFGDPWFDYCYDYPHYEPHCYDPCWYPVYTYPTCGVTFTAYPEVVTVAVAQPIVVDQEITLVAATEELESAKPVVEEQALAETDDLDAIFGGTADNSSSDESTTIEATTEVTTSEQTTDEAANEDRSVAETTAAAAIAETRTTEKTIVNPGAQSDMDLELIDVQMVDAGNREASLGPSFKVTVRNTGKRDLEKFLVSLVACKETQIDSNSVHASTTVEQLTAGAETSISVTLPAEAMSLNRDGQGRQTPYNTLVAAVDSDERVSEGNEENNLALIDRTSIKLANK